MSSARASKASSKVKAAHSASSAAICSLKVAMRAVAAASSLAAFSRILEASASNGMTSPSAWMAPSVSARLRTSRQTRRMRLSLRSSADLSSISLSMTP